MSMYPLLAVTSTALLLNVIVVLMAKFVTKRESTLRSLGVATWLTLSVESILDYGIGKNININKTKQTNNHVSFSGFTYESLCE